MLVTTVTKIQERSPLKYNFGQETIKFGSKGYGIKSREGYKDVPAGVTETETRWKTSEEADTVLAQYRKLASDAKKYHLDKFSSFRIATDRLDSFLFAVLHDQKESQHFVDYSATTPHIVPRASNSRKRIFSQ